MNYRLPDVLRIEYGFLGVGSVGLERALRGRGQRRLRPALDMSGEKTLKIGHNGTIYKVHAYVDLGAGDVVGTTV